jgi:hypothetical protein
MGWDFHFGVARVGFMVGYQHAGSQNDTGSNPQVTYGKKS